MTCLLTFSGANDDVEWHIIHSLSLSLSLHINIHLKICHNWPFYCDIAFVVVAFTISQQLALGTWHLTFRRHCVRYVVCHIHNLLSRLSQLIPIPFPRFLYLLRFPLSYFLFFPACQLNGQLFRVGFPPLICSLLISHPHAFCFVFISIPWNAFDKRNRDQQKLNVIFSQHKMVVFFRAMRLVR